MKYIFIMVNPDTRKRKKVVIQGDHPTEALGRLSRTRTQLGLPAPWLVSDVIPISKKVRRG
jgi:hypothetical protein